MNYLRPSQDRLAARAVALHGPGTLAERKELLDMLGLLDEEGQFRELPPKLTPSQLNDSAGSPGVLRMEPPWDRTHVPPGLRDLPPARTASPGTTPEPKKRRGGRPKVAGPDCGEKKGTVAGYGRHKRGRTPICAECRAAYADWQRDRYRARPSVACGEDRGTPAGVARHRKWHGRLCSDCAQVGKAPPESTESAA